MEDDDLDETKRDKRHARLDSDYDSDVGWDEIEMRIVLVSTNDKGGRDEVSETSAMLILTINVGLDETITLISLCPCTAVHQETRGVDEPTGSGGKPQYLLVEWTRAWDRSVVGSTNPPRLVLSPTDHAAQDEFSFDVLNMPVYVLLEPNPAHGHVFARDVEKISFTRPFISNSEPDCQS